MATSTLDRVDQATLLDDEPAYWCWEPRPDQPGRYDQQAAFYRSQAIGVAGLVGGNGAGTTETAMAKVAKLVLSDQAPPRYDTPFWILGDSYEVIMESCWKEKLYGHGHIPSSEIDWERIQWYKPDNDWPFRVPLKPWVGQTPGRNWVLEFKSYGQGRQQMQARSLGGFCFVEQFPWGVFQEVLRGCREYSFPGSKMFEFTPVDPNLSIELEEMIEEGSLPDGWEIYRANTECALEAGHVSEQWFAEFFGIIPDEMRETRMTGAFASYEGTIYQAFNPAVHLVGDEVIDFPEGVYHRRGIDWGAGPTNAFVCLWAYKNALGQWFVYDELYSTNPLKTTIDHLCEIQDRSTRIWGWRPNNPHYGTTYADPSSPDSIRLAHRLSEYCGRDSDGKPLYDNLVMDRGQNAVLEGIEHVQWVLKTDPALRVGNNGDSAGQPRLFIHRERCPHLARQMRSYRWVRRNEAGINPTDARREPLKRDDHAPDALRYLLFTDHMRSGVDPSSTRREPRDRERGVRFDGPIGGFGPALRRQLHTRRH